MRRLIQLGDSLLGWLRRRVGAGVLAAGLTIGPSACVDRIEVEEEPPLEVVDAPELEAMDLDVPAVETRHTPEVRPRPAPPAPDPEARALARAQAERAEFEREHPWHGIAYHYLAQVRARPDGSSPVVGYMRRGSHFRAQSPLRGPGCERGWHRVPGAGFVCRGQGFALGDSPQSFDPVPVGPAIDDALPYIYGRVARDDVPQYWRIPSRDEEARAIAWIAAQRRSEERARREAPAVAEPEAEPAPDPEAPPGLQVEAEVAAEVEARGDGEAVATASPPSRVRDGGVPNVDAGTPLERPSYLRMRMRRGFYVSIDRMETHDGRRFYRTIRGGYVPVDPIAEVHPPSLRGVVLGGRWSLPLGFVHRGGVRSLSRDASNGALNLAGEVERLSPLPLREEVIVRRGHRYRVASDGRIVREDALRIATPLERPSSIPEGARWIHVDLSSQLVVAYEGDQPVFATLTSTGRAGYETPTGTFRVQSKHLSTTMDDPDAGDEAYSIEDVPWTMYFEGSYALHAAFWHDRFGHVRSHGCVNLSPVDARWLFDWASPSLPPSWHGVFSDRRREGTYVHVTE